MTFTTAVFSYNYSNSFADDATMILPKEFQQVVTLLYDYCGSSILFY
jgi:hypothetical protein